MPDISESLSSLQTTRSVIALGDQRIWTVGTPCPHCGTAQMGAVALVTDGNYAPISGATVWLRCAACLKGAVREGGTIFPTTMPLREPSGLPPTDRAVWHEVRTCLGAGANSAAVMLCRKLLFHIAVANGLSEKKDNGRAPTFAEAVNHLEGEGLMTSKMRPWVERIKDVGNEANHEITPVTAEVALDVATFTQQLLVLAYELDALMAVPGEPDA